MHERKSTIDSRIDTDTGEFDMVMATEGEASDGHIISMRGLQYPAELPLQLDHARSALATLGTVTNIRRSKVDGVDAMRGVGRIRLTGEGDQLEARRDLVDAISRGDVRGTSLTWDSIKHRERRDLPRSHVAYVGRDEKDPRKRFGIFFDESRAVEQSIVAIPSDREALIGRGENAPNEFSRKMWDSLVDRLSDAQPSREAIIIDALEEALAALEERLRAAEDLNSSSDELPAPMPSIETSLSVLTSQIGSVRDRTRAELDDALGSIFERVTGSEYHE